MSDKNSSGRSKSHKRTRTVALIAAVSVVIVAILLVAFFIQISNQPESTPIVVNIVNENVTINAGSYEYYHFSVPVGASSAEVDGTFRVDGGSENVIKVYIMDAANFDNWQNGCNSSKNYDSGTLNAGNITATFTSSATYMLIYDNTFSATSKNVTTRAGFYYIID